ncbi:tetratricopeptide repeat protein [Mucilaginibacter sp. RB4R14]|uniref:tetratricopeptide repeat protein n=1 Tax=Mucilaginibacter aurantiaciroseus TaxID=2949308 RepID=UPI002090CDDE|nr:tetratricopeptide repeat protein [Mucilaginibacter aurantiaciroseus]MCO5935542.1 tetratricopeptide repeat protein [Mucilaginibacter aurantiaciroseus]
MRFLVSTLFFLIAATGISSAQDAAGLTKEGQQLYRHKQYTAAIEKYKAALTAEPDNARANYEMALGLFSSGKGPDGLPYLEKSIKANASVTLTAASYSLMGSIYGNSKQLPKAIEAYRNGIKTDSTNQRIYYNLGIVQYRSKLYPDAEQSFISAIKRDSMDTGSIRMYALVTFHENKRADAVLGLSRFLQLQPNAARSKEAFGNLQNILQRGTLEAEVGYISTAATKAEAFAQNKITTKVLAGFMTRKYASPTALLSAQLRELFTIFATQPKPYRYSPYFYKLSQTDNFETFVKVISQSSFPENAAWVKNNADNITVLNSWMKANKAD